MFGSIRRWIRYASENPLTYDLLFSVAAGTAAALLLIAFDGTAKMQRVLLERYMSLHRPVHVVAELIVISVVVALLFTVAILRSLPKFQRSLKLTLAPVQRWILVPGVAAFWIACEWNHLRTAVALIIAAVAAMFAARLISKSGRKIQGSTSALLEADLPIPENGEDLLGRRDMVESMVSIIMIERPSIIALTGAYGDGKTSFLNLVVGELKRAPEPERPIVVRFSPWLAADSNALVLSLLDSVVAEIKRSFIVPGLSGDAARFARTLLSAIPRTERLKDLFSEPS